MISRKTKGKSASVRSFLKSLSNSKLATNHENSQLAMNKIEPVTKIVESCRSCKMIQISERRRVLCPYCGTFFDPNEERLVVRNDRPRANYDSANNVGRGRLGSARSSNSGSGSANCSDDDDYDDDENRIRKRDRVRQFLSSLVPFRKRSGSIAGGAVKGSEINSTLPRLPAASANPKLMNSKSVDQSVNNQQKLDDSIKPMHPFIDTKNNEPDFMTSYRKEAPRSQEEFNQLIDKANETNDYKEVLDFYVWWFSSAENLCELLVSERVKEENSTKRQSDNNNNNNDKKSDPCYHTSINWKFMREIYVNLDKMPSDVCEANLQAISFTIVNNLRTSISELKGVINRNGGRLFKKNENGVVDSSNQEMQRAGKLLVQVVHCVVIFICNPLFDKTENDTLLAVVLSEICNMSSQIQNSFIYSLRRMPLNLFREVLKRTQQFMTNRLFPHPKVKQLTLSVDWLPAAVKFIAILHYTNELQIKYYQHHFNEFTNDAVVDYNEKRKHLEKTNERSAATADELIQPISNIVSSSSAHSSLFVSYQEFYAKRLDTLDLFKEFTQWQELGKIENGFSFCHYPFLLSIDGKRKILERDSEQQMLDIARKSYLNNARGRIDPKPLSTDLFLTLRIRRNYIIADSLNEIEAKKSHLKKKLKVTFVGEQAVDMGGVKKEWFLLVIRKIFTPVYGMFNFIKESGCYWFTTSSSKDMLSEYHLIGTLMGLAVYNGEILDIRFPSVVYKKLLTVETPSLNSDCTIGTSRHLTLYDLKQVMPDLASSLYNMLEFEGDVQDTFMLKFQVSYTEYDTVKTVALKRNGENIDLTNENRKEYVDLYVDFLLNKLIYEQFKAFYLGFHSVCASNAMLLFRPEEIESLVCGSTEPLNISELRQITIYENYTETDKVIEWFWDILKNEFDSKQNKKMLLFTTGSDRIPISGVKDMSFKIVKIESKNQLPMAHTCFNQLILPQYADRDTLKTKLLVAIENAEGFGFK